MSFVPLFRPFLNCIYSEWRADHAACGSEASRLGGGQVGCFAGLIETGVFGHFEKTKCRTSEEKRVWRRVRDGIGFL